MPNRTTPDKSKPSTKEKQDGLGTPLSADELRKQPAPQWLTMDQAIKHCTAGIGIWEWASNDRGGEPAVVMACCGDIPTLEVFAAVKMLRGHFPELKVRLIILRAVWIDPQPAAQARAPLLALRAEDVSDSAASGKTWST